MTGWKSVLMGSIAEALLAVANGCLNEALLKTKKWACGKLPGQGSTQLSWINFSIMTWLVFRPSGGKRSRRMQEMAGFPA